MKLDVPPKFNGPIPGENFTADTRNYPWHRPPEITDFNEGVTYLINRLDEERESQLLHSLLQLDIPVAIITSNLLMRNIARGKFPIDLAILMAGPIARYIEIIGKDTGSNPDMSTDIPGQEPITPTMLKLQMGAIKDLKDLDGKAAEAADSAVEPAQEASNGLMGAPDGQMVDVAPVDEQDAMLGYTNEQEQA